MDASRRRRSYLLLPLVLSALWLGVVASPVRADVDYLPPPGEYQPVESSPQVESISLPDLSGLPVLLATLFGTPPSMTVQEIVYPSPAPTLVLPTPPTPPPPPQLAAASFSGTSPGTFHGAPTMQSFTSWTPVSTPPNIANVTKTPEPGTLLSGVLGLGVLAWYRRRVLA